MVYTILLSGATPFAVSARLPVEKSRINVHAPPADAMATGLRLSPASRTCNSQEKTMSSKTGVIIVVVFCCVVTLGAVQQPGMGSQAASSQAATASAAENAQLRQMAARADDVQVLRDDIKRMRAMVRQMETNLAFVDNTQSPLKHQFQLDIDMWRIVIDHLERRVQR
jgi:hypothetical protein